MRKKIDGPHNKSLEDYKIKKDPEGKNFRRLLAFIIVVVTLSIGVGGAVIYFFAPDWSKVFTELFGELWPVMVAVIAFYFGIDIMKGGRNAN